MLFGFGVAYAILDAGGGGGGREQDTGYIYALRLPFRLPLYASF